ncbi:MAG: hypothetical protein Q8L48_08060 [Archangium sp.]|nr:hypothetical protein [Archangium sp.]
MKAIEAVGRFWARQLALEPTDVLLLLLIARTEQTPTTLGHLTGRKRQQVHRSLVRLEDAGLVEAATYTRRGRVAAWRLNKSGIARLECLERRMHIWEEHLVGRVDVNTLLVELRSTLRALVNRTMEGYLAGLYHPDELRRDPNLEFVREAESLRTSLAHAREQPSPTALRKATARKLAEDAELQDLQAVSASWRARFS